MRKLAIIAIAFITLTATAQRGNKNKERGNNLSIEEIARLKTKKMTLALVLNEDQIKEVHTLNIEQTKKRKTMRDARKNEKEDTQKNHFEQREKILDNRIAVQNRMQDILDKEQFILWRKIVRKHKKQKRLETKK